VSTPPVMARRSSTMVMPSLFSLVEGGGTHPLAVGPVNPGLSRRTGRSDRQRRWVPQEPGPGRRIVRRTARTGVSRFGGQAGPRLPTLRPNHRKTAQAEPGPEALSTSSLPIPCGWQLGLPSRAAAHRSSTRVRSIGRDRRIMSPACQRTLIPVFACINARPTLAASRDLAAYLPRSGSESYSEPAVAGL
jgi:hypothetical protein